MIRIGTDCSGIEAPIQALLQLGIPFQHVWACDKDKFVRKSILANYHPGIIYDDITIRDHNLLPDVDIYVCGFPCQPFSTMGKGKGTSDPRSNIMSHCIEVIKIKQPNIFILENVKNFKFIEKGIPFNFLLQQLNDLNLYNIYSGIYNTKDYGIPQNRQRLYIIGIKKSIQKSEYIKPPPIDMKPLDDFILDKTIQINNNIPQTIKNKLIKINYQHNYICCCDSNSLMKDLSPTLSRSGCKYMFHTTYNRYLTYKECLLLQGFPLSFANVVGGVNLCHQIGNSMSVNVLKFIFINILKTID